MPAFTGGEGICRPISMNERLAFGRGLRAPGRHPVGGPIQARQVLYARQHLHVRFRGVLGRACIGAVPDIEWRRSSQGCLISSASPILLRLPPHRLARRVLHLEPVRRAAGAIGRSPSASDDAFQPHPAGVAEHGLTVVEFQMLVEPDAGAALARTDASVALRTTSGSRRRSSPFSSIRSKAYRNTQSS